MDTLVEAMGASTRQQKSFQKVTGTTVAGAYFATWLMAGKPGIAAAPSSGVAGDVPTDATAGAFPFTNPSGGDSTYLSNLAASATQSGTLFLYDRLWHNSGLSPTTTTAQTVASVALTRPDANGADVEAWFEAYTAMGAGTGGTMTISYTDQDGNTGQTGTLTGMTASSVVGRTYQYSLAAGDSGVRAIASETHTATMNSGTYGLVMRRKIATLCLPVAGVATTLDPFDLGLPRIYDDAAIEVIYQAQTTTAATLNGFLLLVQN